MKRLFLVTLVSLFGTIVNAQKVSHHSYIAYYNAAKGEPDSVSWNLNPTMVSCGPVTRIDKFAQDPNISNSTKPQQYSNTGYDKGHLFPFADAQCNSVDKIECFYMTNMLPQLHSLNAGDWKTLETQERVWAASESIHIIAGGFGSIGRLPSGINIPESCWKAIYVGHKWRAWVIPNKSTSKGHDYLTWEVRDIKRFNSIVGLHL